MTDPIEPGIQGEPTYGQPAAPYQPTAPYGQPVAPYQPTAPYGQPGQYGQPSAYGQPTAPYGYQLPAPPTNVFAIVSLVSAFFIAVVAIITGHIALSQIKKTGEQGRGLALAGLIIGYAEIGIAVLAFVVIGIIWLAAVSTAVSTGSLSN
jgi:Domain of unknown function (DUF4190)